MTVITEHIPKSLLQAMQPLGADRTAKPFSLQRHFCGDGQEGVKHMSLGQPVGVPESPCLASRTLSPEDSSLPRSESVHRFPNDVQF